MGGGKFDLGQSVCSAELATNKSPPSARDLSLHLPRDCGVIAVRWPVRNSRVSHFHVLIVTHADGRHRRAYTHQASSVRLTGNFKLGIHARWLTPRNKHAAPSSSTRVKVTAVYGHRRKTHLRRCPPSHSLLVAAAATAKMFVASLSWSPRALIGRLYEKQVFSAMQVTSDIPS